MHGCLKRINSFGEVEIFLSHTVAMNSNTKLVLLFIATVWINFSFIKNKNNFKNGLF